MKPKLKAHRKTLLPAIVTAVALLLACPAPAQTVTNLYSFTGGGSDGGLPWAGLILSGNTLYGTARQGGNVAAGSVFSIQTDGTGFTTLYAFAGGNDGTLPSSDLLLAGGTLYGTAYSGGANGFGTVFAVNTNGSGFTNLYSFAGGSDGANPYAGLALSGGTLYGTASSGNVLNDGEVFAVGTNATGYQAVYLFNGASDGNNPFGPVIVSGTTLYGTAKSGGDGGSGTVFKVNTDGTGFTTLHAFTDLADGGLPYGRLVLLSNKLYGTTYEGGTASLGTIFAVSTTGTGFTNLHSFTGGSDGANPYAGLLLVGSKLYGTTFAGGNSANGTLFVINTDGTGYTNLYSFTGADGSHPYGGLVASGNKLYGTTVYGGTTGNGTVFCFSPGLPRLTINQFGNNVVVTWPTTFSGFTLQATTNLVSTPVWTTVSPSPVVINGLNTVTNSVTGSRKFYRLIQ